MSRRVLADLLALRKLFWEPTAWTKGVLHDGNSHCLIGGIEIATGYTYCERYRYLKQALGYRYNVAWNDSPTTSFTDLHRVIESAIAREEGRLGD